jgi:hypothetical protein
MEDRPNIKAITRIRTRWIKGTFIPDEDMEKKVQLEVQEQAIRPHPAEFIMTNQVLCVTKQFSYKSYCLPICLNFQTTMKTIGMNSPHKY